MRTSTKPITSSPTAQKIRIFRKHLKMSQIEFAKELNRMQSTISRWERGEAEPDGETLRLLHDKHGMAYDWYGGGNVPMIEGTVKKMGLTDVQQIKNENKHLIIRIEKLEATVNQLVRDLYAKKAGV